MPQNLAERCEKALGSDRELDALIWCALHGKKYRAHYQAYGSLTYGSDETQVEFTEPPKRTRCVSGSFGLPHALRYTASLDAAMSLVPEGWSILFAWNGERCVADVHTKPIGNPDGVWPAHSSACSAALALTAASLRARGL